MCVCLFVRLPKSIHTRTLHLENNERYEGIFGFAFHNITYKVTHLAMCLQTWIPVENKNSLIREDATI